ncbi:MAG TPA: 4Fe-4S binding protein [Pyrinomonadaceae bacterium]|jgi:ferredoxin|nr:4Fe-4S binding protein [Pyrinomonadaceae bacterium]HWP52801.1 4Fe-4S binding protein [Pyrinomonadaceae bacterium]
MAYTITEDCINCDACRPECPTESVHVGEDTYEIDANTCVECVDFYDEPKCVELCPIDCIEHLTN